MTRAEIARLLALIQAFDRRTVGESDVWAWHDVLADIRFDAAVDAVKNHYRNSREFLMPADIRQYVKSHSKTLPYYRAAREVIAEMNQFSSSQDEAIAARVHHEIETGNT